MSRGAQKLKTGPDTLGTAENESGRKTLKLDPTLSVPSEPIPGAQNMKTGADALSTAKTEYGHAKHENETRLPRYRRKLFRARKT
jgi:hypothetical protein